MDGPSHLSHDTSASGSARQHSSHPFYSGQEATPKQSSRQGKSSAAHSCNTTMDPLTDVKTMAVSRE